MLLIQLPLFGLKTVGGVLEAGTGSRSPQRPGGWPPVLHANGVSGTQRRLCSRRRRHRRRSTLACCGRAGWNRGPVWASMSGTCVLLLNIAATMAAGKYLSKKKKKKAEMISAYSSWIKPARHLFFHRRPRSWILPRTVTYLKHWHHLRYGGSCFNFF